MPLKYSEVCEWHANDLCFDVLNITLGPFHLISTPPVDEFSQNLPPKKKKIKVPTQQPPQKLTDFSFPPQKKTHFSSNLSEKAAKIKGSRRINPSETTFLAPSEKLVNSGGVYIKWNGPYNVKIHHNLIITLHVHTWLVPWLTCCDYIFVGDQILQTVGSVFFNPACWEMTWLQLVRFYILANCRAMHQCK